MTVHLDTNTVVAHLRGSAAVSNRISASLPNVAMSSVVLGELLYGARASNRPVENRQRVLEFASLVGIISFDESCAEQYGEIRFALRVAGKPSGEADILIAAVALVHDATLVTHNTKHFADIPGLRLEDWLS